MSLETAMAELTAELKRLNANLELASGVANGVSPKASSAAAPQEPPKRSPGRPPKAVAAEEKPVEEDIPYETVREAFQHCAEAVGAEAVMKVLKEFNVSTAKKLVPGQYKGFIAALQREEASA